MERHFRYKSLSCFSLHRRRRQSRLSEGHQAAGTLLTWEPLLTICSLGRAGGQLQHLPWCSGARLGLVGRPEGKGFWRKKVQFPKGSG